jgi:hypothetical protein
MAMTGQRISGRIDSGEGPAGARKILRKTEEENKSRGREGGRTTMEHGTNQTA